MYVHCKCLIPRFTFECVEAISVIHKAIIDLPETFVREELIDWDENTSMAEASFWKDPASDMPTRLFIFVRRNHRPGRLSSVTFAATGTDGQRIEEIFEFICTRLKEAGCKA